jgi:putative membrane protein
MKRPLLRLVFRWSVNSLGLWVAANIFEKISYQDDFKILLIAGLVLSLVNAVIKPILVVLSLPAILITVGLFMLIVNGLMVVLVTKLYPQFEVGSFGAAVLAGIIIGLVNYLVTIIIEDTSGHE